MCAYLAIALALRCSALLCAALRCPALRWLQTLRRVQHTREVAASNQRLDEALAPRLASPACQSTPTPMASYPVRLSVQPESQLHCCSCRAASSSTPRPTFSRSCARPWDRSSSMRSSTCSRAQRRVARTSALPRLTTAPGNTGSDEGAREDDGAGRCCSCSRFVRSSICSPGSDEERARARARATRREGAEETTRSATSDEPATAAVAPQKDRGGG